LTSSPLLPEKGHHEKGSVDWHCYKISNGNGGKCLQ